MSETRPTELVFDECPLPREGDAANVVQWHVFRSREEAERFAPAIRLGPGQQLVVGRTRDSLGPLWWVGVQVDDLERWGNRLAVNKHAE